MTQLPPDPLFALPFRPAGSKKTEWQLLTKFVRTTHGTKFNVGPAIDKMADLRKQIAAVCVHSASASSAPAVNEAFIENTLKPYIQLVAMAQGHLPIHSGNIQKFVFSWKTAWDFAAEATSDNANLELVSCIYNMGAAYAAIGRSEVLTNTAEGAKNGFKFFQMAAGVYEYVATLVQRVPADSVTADLAPDALQLCQKVALTQAHHCSFLKAAVEMRGKTAILSKIAVEAAQQYQETADACRAVLAVSKTQLGVALIASCETFQNAFTARAHTLHGEDRMAAEDIGAALGRFRFADEAALRAVNVAGKARQLPGSGVERALVDAMSYLRHHIGEMNAKALHENETVHFERATKEFPPLERLGKSMAKATPCPSLTTFKAKREDDPFFGIVPAHVAAVVATMQHEMRAQTQLISEQVATHRSRIRDGINSLGVIAAIEALAGGEGKTKGRVPETLRAKIIALQQAHAAGGGLVQSLVAMMSHTVQVSASVAETLDAITQQLREELEEDLQFRSTYGEKLWGELRKPSGQLPDVRTLKKLVVDIQEAVAREVTAPTNDAKSRLEANIREVARLDWQLDDLDALMPFTKTRAVQESDAVVTAAVDRLKKLLARIDQIEDIEAAKLRELRESHEGDALARQLSAVCDDQQEAAKEALMTEFTDRLAVITSTMSSADAVVEEAQEHMMNLAQLRSEDPVANEIQRVCNGIEGSISVFNSVHQTLSNAAASAASLAEQATNALSIAQSFREGRHVEALDFSTSLEAQVAAKVREMHTAGGSSSESASHQRQAELQRQIEALEEQRRKSQQQQQQQQVSAFQPPQGYPIAHQQQQQQQQHYVVGYAAPAQTAPPPFYGYAQQPQQPPQQQRSVNQPAPYDQYQQQYQQQQLDALFGGGAAPPPPPPYAPPGYAAASPSSYGSGFDPTAAIPPPPNFGSSRI